MNRNLFVLFTLALMVICVSKPGFAITPIPQESGISGFINIGGGVITAESNMIAGNDFGDIGEKRIDSLTDSPDSKTTSFR